MSNPITKKYVLFAGHRYYPKGGASDFKAFGTVKFLKELFSENIDKWNKENNLYTGTHWGEIAKRKTMRIICTKVDDGEWK